MVSEVNYAADGSDVGLGSVNVFRGKLCEQTEVMLV